MRIAKWEGAKGMEGQIVGICRRRDVDVVLRPVSCVVLAVYGWAFHDVISRNADCESCCLHQSNEYKEDRSLQSLLALTLSTASRPFEATLSVEGRGEVQRR